MKKKALIIGALPEPFEGPWVDTNGNEWDVKMLHDYDGKVMVEYDDDKRTRAVILEAIPGVPHVSVWLEAKNARGNHPTVRH
jgi:hypothetical protein